MTHTLHRLLDETEDTDDFVMFSMPAKGYNDHNVWDRVDRNYKIMHRCDAVNIGGYDAGVFSDKETLKKALAEIKKADLGVSIIISGKFEDIYEVCEALDVQPHTVEFSLGIFGKKELLADENTLAITTMCGHGLVGPNYVQEITRKVRKGKMTSIEGAKRLAKPCYCGVFNPERAAALIENPKHRNNGAELNEVD